MGCGSAAARLAERTAESSDSPQLCHGVESRDAAAQRRASAHGLQHSHGSHAVNGRPGRTPDGVQIVRNKLGQASISTTSGYLRSWSPDSTHTKLSDKCATCVSEQRECLNEGSGAQNGARHVMAQASNYPRSRHWPISTTRMHRPPGPVRWRLPANQDRIAPWPWQSAVLTARR